MRRALHLGWGMSEKCPGRKNGILHAPRVWLAGHDVVLHFIGFSVSVQKGYPDMELPTDLIRLVLKSENRSGNEKNEREQKPTMETTLLRWPKSARENPPVNHKNNMQKSIGWAGCVPKKPRGERKACWSLGHEHIWRRFLKDNRISWAPVWAERERQRKARARGGGGLAG